jgi:hypothetical protein
MSKQTFKVTDYDVVLGHKMQMVENGPYYRGYIVCYGKTSVYRLGIYFIRPGEPDQVPKYYSQVKGGAIYVPIAEMQNYLDMLRNEGPVYATVYTNSPYEHYLATSKEPVGEGE